ncbi:hypothetical protein CBR_g34500 [Chara braunii]|uniref:Uncharacterized protein n=1 Tax=Chara braunii TaxID=69332 RepID=A0A388LIS5_CHABU|nr:hypothetical protein CBR_g34500 [Chara braunii]|eukprot:GBG82218.1 hypothetical protein CBR_g34500 [Chara braunii]
MNARLDSMYEVVRGQKQNGAAEEQKIDSLFKEVEELRLAQGGERNDGASTSWPAIRDDALLARIMQEHEEMKAKQETVTAVNQRVEALEASLKAIKQQHEAALKDNEDWKKEALRTGNKRSRLATSPSSQLKIPSSVPRRPSAETGSVDPTQLAQLHTLQVNALKQLRLQELNQRWEAEQENVRLKEELAKREAERTTLKSAFQQQLNSAGGSVLKTTRDKKKVGDGEEVGGKNGRENFIREARKELASKKKNDLVEICMKEGIKYSTIPRTITDIIEKRVEKALGKKATIQNVSEDDCDDDGKNDGRDSTNSSGPSRA